jgi:hypothetical protein
MIKSDGRWDSFDRMSSTSARPGPLRTSQLCPTILTQMPSGARTLCADVRELRAMALER